MGYDPNEPRDKQGQWTHLSDIEDPTSMEGTLRVQLPGGRAGEVRGYTPEMAGQPGHFHVLPDGSKPGYEVAVRDAKIIEHRK